MLPRRRRRLRDLCFHLAEIKQAPSQRAPTGGLERPPIKQGAGFYTVEAKRAGKGDLGVVVRDRHTNSLIRGGEPALSGNNIGPAAQDVQRLIGITNRRDFGILPGVMSSFAYVPG